MAKPSGPPGRRGGNLGPLGPAPWLGTTMLRAVFEETARRWQANARTLRCGIGLATMDKKKRAWDTELGVLLQPLRRFHHVDCNFYLVQKPPKIHANFTLPYSVGLVNASPPFFNLLGTGVACTLHMAIKVKESVWRLRRVGTLTPAMSCHCLWGQEWRSGAARLGLEPRQSLALPPGRVAVREARLGRCARFHLPQTRAQKFRQLRRKSCSLSCSSFWPSSCYST